MSSEALNPNRYADVLNLLQLRQESVARRPTAGQIAVATHCSEATVHRVAAGAREQGLLEQTGGPGRMPLDRRAIVETVASIDSVQGERARVAAIKLGCSSRTVYRAQADANK